MILGKLFEKHFKEQMDKQENVFCLRLPDPMGGFKGLANICDFIVYKYPFLYLFELKTTSGSSLPFANISEKQFYGLKEVEEKFVTIKAGFLVWFYDKDITYFVFPSVLHGLQQQGKKSIRYDNKDVCLIGGEKKKKYFEYNWPNFFQTMEGEGCILTKNYKM